MTEELTHEEWLALLVLSLSEVTDVNQAMHVTIPRALSSAWNAPAELIVAASPEPNAEAPHA